MQNPDSIDPKTILDLLKTVHDLRAPGGCPWDRAQTHQTLRPFLLEETYEVMDILDQLTRDDQVLDPILGPLFKEELGDLLLQVLIHAELASEKGAFGFPDVAKTLNEKLIVRHPHVFGEVKVDGADQAYRSWEKTKLEKKKKNAGDVLDGVPKALPALQRTSRIIEKVTRVGFQWPDINGPMEKLDEEMRELKEEIHKPEQDRNPARIEDEIGDLLFSICNVAFKLKLNPEDALRRTLAKFESRFQHVESSIRAKGKEMTAVTLEEMDQHWNEAKAMEKGRAK